MPHSPARRANAAAGSWRLSRLLLPLRRLLRVSSLLARGLLLSGAEGHTPGLRSLFPMSKLDFLRPAVELVSTVLRDRTLPRACGCARGGGRARGGRAPRSARARGGRARSKGARGRCARGGRPQAGARHARPAAAAAGAAGTRAAAGAGAASGGGGARAVGAPSPAPSHAACTALNIQRAGAPLRRTPPRSACCAGDCSTSLGSPPAAASPASLPPSSASSGSSPSLSCAASTSCTTNPPCPVAAGLAVRHRRPSAHVQLRRADVNRTPQSRRRRRRRRPHRTVAWHLYSW